MSLAALTLAAAATLAAPQPESRAESAGVQLAHAKVSAVILKAAILRQDSGLEHQPDAPQVQVTRYEGKVLFEFQ